VFEKFRSWIGKRVRVETEPTLVQQILNQPESSCRAAPKYPPVVKGIPALSLKEILSAQKSLLKQINATTETAQVFENRYWPAIERYARNVHLLPASESYHHCGIGGLLHHGLEVGLFAMEMAWAGIYGKDLFNKKREGRERWLFACFMAGLCHDLGKVAIDIQVTSETGMVWSPYDMELIAWTVQNGIKKYYVNWRPDRNHQEHELYTWSMFERVLTEDDRHYIGEIDGQLLGNCIRAITAGTRAVEQATNEIYDIARLVREADSKSTVLDRSRSRSPQDFGMEVPRPLIRHFLDGMQRLLSEKHWKINEPGGAVWVLGREQAFYLVWPRCGNELYALLLDEKVKRVPADPLVIADMLNSYNILKPAPDGGYCWQIKPSNLKGETLIAVRLEETWLPSIIDVLPPGLENLEEPLGTANQSPPLSPGENDSGMHSGDDHPQSPSDDENPVEFFSYSGLGGEVLLRLAQDMAAGVKTEGADFLLGTQVCLAWGEKNKIIKNYPEYKPAEVLQTLVDLGWLDTEPLGAGKKVRDVKGLGRALVLTAEISERFRLLVENFRKAAPDALPVQDNHEVQTEIREAGPDREPGGGNGWPEEIAGWIQCRGWADYKAAIDLIRAETGSDQEMAELLLRLYFDLKFFRNL